MVGADRREAALDPNPLMLMAAVLGAAAALGLFRLRFGRDTLALALQLAGLSFVVALIAAAATGEDIRATLTFSYPSHSANKNGA